MNSNHNENIIKTIEPSTYNQIEIIERMVNSDYKGGQRGVCYGISYMIQQAFFADNIELLNKRLDFIRNIPLYFVQPEAKPDFINWIMSNIKYSPSFLVETLKNLPLDDKTSQTDEIKKILEMFHNKQDIIISEETSKWIAETIYWDIIATFEGIDLYYLATNYPQIFNDENRPKEQLVGEDIVSTIVYPKSLTDKQLYLNRVGKFDAAHTLQELKYFLNTLSETQLENKINIILGSVQHAISIGYDPKKKQWYFGDPNTLPVSEDTLENLATKIFEAFKEPVEGTIIYSAKVYANIHVKKDQEQNEQEKKEEKKEALERNRIKNWVHEVQWLTENQSKVISNRLNVKDENIIRTAIASDNLDLIKHIHSELTTENFKKIINHQYKNGQNALHVAVQYGRDDILDYLLQNGADQNSKEENGFTVLHGALAKSTVNIEIKTIKKLIDHKAELSTANNKGHSLLYHALTCNNVEILKLLLTTQPELGNINNKKVQQMLVLSLSNRTSVEIIDYMKAFNVQNKFTDQPLFFNFQTDGGYTMLHFAVTFKDIDMVKYLLKEGADPSIADNKKCNALDRAYDARDEEIIKLLEEQYPNLEANQFVKSISIDLSQDNEIAPSNNTSPTVNVAHEIPLKFQHHPISDAFIQELSKIENQELTNVNNNTSKNIINKFKLFVGEKISTPLLILKLFNKYPVDTMNYIEQVIFLKNPKQVSELEKKIITHSSFNSEKLSPVGKVFYEYLTGDRPIKKNNLVNNKLSIAVLLYVQYFIDYLMPMAI